MVIFDKDAVVCICHLTRDWFTSVLAASKDPKGPQQVPTLIPDIQRSPNTYSSLRAPTHASHTLLTVTDHRTTVAKLLSFLTAPPTFTSPLSGNSSFATRPRITQP